MQTKPEIMPAFPLKKLSAITHFFLKLFGYDCLELVFAQSCHSVSGFWDRTVSRSALNLKKLKKNSILHLVIHFLYRSSNFERELFRQKIEDPSEEKMSSKMFLEKLSQNFILGIFSDFIILLSGLDCKCICS